MSDDDFSRWAGGGVFCRNRICDNLVESLSFDTEVLVEGFNENKFDFCADLLRESMVVFSFIMPYFVKRKKRRKKKKEPKEPCFFTTKK